MHMYLKDTTGPVSEVSWEPFPHSEPPNEDRAVKITQADQTVSFHPDMLDEVVRVLTEAAHMAREV